MLEEDFSSLTDAHIYSNALWILISYTGLSQMSSVKSTLWCAIGWKNRQCNWYIKLWKMIDTENCEIDNPEFAHYHSTVTNKFVRTTSEHKAAE